MPEPRDLVAFPILTEAQIGSLRTRAAEVSFAPEEALWKPGDTEFCCFIILTGWVEIRDSNGLVATHGPGEFSGDIDNLSGRPSNVGGYATEPTITLQISADDLREIVRIDQDLGGILVTAFLRRREILLSEEGHGSWLIGSRYDPETAKMREFLARNRILHKWTSPEDGDTAQLLRNLGLGVGDTPLLLLNGKRLSQPSLEDLGRELGVRPDVDRKQFDLVVIGAGPAGLAAGVYGSSEGLSTLLLDRVAPGGQAGWSSRIENYMGFPEGLSGAELAARGIMQAEKFGTTLSVPSDVSKIQTEGSIHQLSLTTGEVIDARAVLIATGARYQKLDVPGFAELETRGVFYAATGSEAQLCSDTEVMVVGAGNSAGQAAVYLSTRAPKVRLVVRGNQLNKNMSDYLSYRVEQIPNIEVLLETEVTACEGENWIERVYLKGRANGCVPCGALFVFIGAIPNTEFALDVINCDPKGFIITGEAGPKWPVKRLPYYLETSVPGILAAGDCRAGSVKRVASSVGEGSMAITFIHRILAA